MRTEQLVLCEAETVGTFEDRKASWVLVIQSQEIFELGTFSLLVVLQIKTHLMVFCRLVMARIVKEKKTKIFLF